MIPKKSTDLFTQDDIHLNSTIFLTVWYCRSVNRWQDLSGSMLHILGSKLGTYHSLALDKTGVHPTPFWMKQEYELALWFCVHEDRIT